MCNQVHGVVMIHRILEDRIRNTVQKKKVVTILGPRQVGKSTLASGLAGSGTELLELNGDESDVQSMFEAVNETQLRYLIGDRKWLLVDEAQKIRNVGNMLKIVGQLII